MNEDELLDQITLALNPANHLDNENQSLDPHHIFLTFGGSTISEYEKIVINNNMVKKNQTATGNIDISKDKANIAGCSINIAISNGENPTSFKPVDETSIYPYKNFVDNLLLNLRVKGFKTEIFKEQTTIQSKYHYVENNSIFNFIIKKMVMGYIKLSMDSFIEACMEDGFRVEEIKIIIDVFLFNLNNFLMPLGLQTVGLSKQRLYAALEERTEIEDLYRSNSTLADLINNSFIENLRCYNDKELKTHMLNQLKDFKSKFTEYKDIDINKYYNIFDQALNMAGSKKAQINFNEDELI